MWTSVPPGGRRDFLRAGMSMLGLGLLAGCAGRTTPPSSRVSRIGFLASNEFGDPLVGALRGGLQDHGHVEGQNVAFEVRFQAPGSTLLPTLAAELVGLDPDVIVVAGSEAALAAKAATQTIPIVIGSVSDPVALGLVESLARPGGNVTGLSTVNTGLTRKRAELLADIAPGIARLGVAWYSGAPPAPAAQREAEAAAEHLGIRVIPLEVPDLAGLRGSIRGRVDALLVPGGPHMFTDRADIVGLALEVGLPSMYSRREWTEAGGLVSYGPNFSELYRRAGGFVDKILRGARPADLPVEQADEYELVLNLTTAQTIGLPVPDTVLQQVTGIIQ